VTVGGGDRFPFAETLGMSWAGEADSPAGREAIVHMEAGPEHLNRAGTVHGGVVASMVDTAMGQAVREATEGTKSEDATPATSQLTITYLDPAQAGSLVATARVRKRGSSLTVVEADVEQNGRAVAHAVATFALLQG
jgi:uncharacterized protein (TIGR00369 family)